LTDANPAARRGVADFRRCRRAWDLSASSRRSLEAVEDSPDEDVADALRRALAVYYFPGMWDWDRAFVERLTIAELKRSLPDPSAELARAEAALTRYFRWAPGVDVFAPVRIAADFEVRLPDPGAPERGLLDATGRPVDYAGRIDLLMTDEADRYWLLRHRVSRGAWTSEQLLRLDDRDVADCWAWQAFFPGLEIAGTVSNELRLDLATETSPMPPPSERSARLAQHAPSGGGRSIPTHRRARLAAVEQAETFRVDADDAFRRTWIARSPREIDAAAARTGMIALDMMDPALRVYPTPSPAHCPECPFQAPCVAMNEGQSAEELLAASYRVRRRPTVEPGRLGAVTWGMGRGAAPPGWARPDPDHREP